MTSSANTLRYLFGLQYRGMKFGLRNIRALLAIAGHPENAFPSVHVAGTNGKGSTSAFLASMFREAGCRTGLYTSPHLVRFTERITVNGKEIPDEQLAYYVRVLRPAIEETRATFFEATTCIAFLYFADTGVDVAVVEAGLGGRLDATNVLRPMISVVTNVTFDHMEFLGTTIQKIAREKAGIIKRGVPVVTASDNPEVVGVLRRTASLRGTRLYRSANLVRTDSAKPSGRIRLRAGGTTLPRPGLPGDFQLCNAGLAVAAAILLRRRPVFRRAFPGLKVRAMGRGLARVRANTGLRGRLETINAGVKILIDVAHNPDGMRVLARELRKMKHPPRVAVFGVMKEKEYSVMLDVLSGVVATLVAVAPATKRALPVRTIVQEARRRGLHVVTGGSVASGLRRAKEMAGNRPVLVTGSHYVAGEVLRLLRGKEA